MHKYLTTTLVGVLGLQYSAAISRRRYYKGGTTQAGGTTVSSTVVGRPGRPTGI